MAPVASPFATPQRRSSCHGASICVVSSRADRDRGEGDHDHATDPESVVQARRERPAEPVEDRLIATAAEIVARDQPNSSWSGTISTPTVDRKPAAVISVRNETAAITQP